MLKGLRLQVTYKLRIGQKLEVLLVLTLYPLFEELKALLIEHVDELGLKVLVTVPRATGH